MKCPYCGNEMTDGFVQSGHGIFFTTKKHSDWLWPNRSKGEFFLNSNNWTAPTCVARHCSNCKKVIINYAEETD